MGLNSDLKEFFYPERSRNAKNVPAVDQGKNVVAQMCFNLCSFVPSQFVFHKLVAAARIDIVLEEVPIAVLILKETKQPINDKCFGSICKI